MKIGPFIPEIKPKTVKKDLIWALGGGGGAFIGRVVYWVYKIRDNPGNFYVHFFFPFLIGSFLPEIKPKNVKKGLIWALGGGGGGSVIGRGRLLGVYTYETTRGIFMCIYFFFFIFIMLCLCRMPMGRQMSSY